MEPNGIAMSGNGVTRVVDAPAILNQTERLQGAVERLGAAVATLEEKAHMILAPVSDGNKADAYLEPVGMSPHAAAMNECNNGIEHNIDRIQALAARIDH